MVFTSSNSKIIRMYLKTFCDSDLPTKGFKTQRADSASIGLCHPRRLKRYAIADNNLK